MHASSTFAAVSLLIASTLPKIAAHAPASGKYDKLRINTACALDKKTAIKNVQVFDGHAFSAPKTIVIDGCTIGNSEDISGATSIDGTGRFLVPGLIESHAHPRNITHLQLQASAGVTTTFSLGCQPNSECLDMMGIPGVADLHTSGQAAIAKGSRHSHIPGMNTSLMVSAVEDVGDFFDRTIESGAELIKIVAEDPPDGPSAPVIRAISEGATKRGYLATSHVVSREAYLTNLAAGIRFLQHMPIDRLLEVSDIQTYSNQFICPTLSIMLAASTPGGMRPVPYNYSIAVANLQLMRQHNVVIVAGTDVSDLPMPLVPSVMDSQAFHNELRLMVEAGMSNLEVLRAATVVPSAVWGLHDRGEIVPGSRADLILLEKNPLADIRNIGSIVKVWAAGYEVADDSRDINVEAHPEL